MLELGEAFEGHAEGVLGAIQIQEGEGVLAEEGAVQTGLEHGVGTQGADPVEGVHHELMTPLAVMDIAGTVQDIEKLPGLGHGAKQVVVTAGPLPFGVVADGGTFGMSARGYHRPVEVEGQTRQLLTLERMYHQGRGQLAHVGPIRGAQGRQGATDGGHVR